MGYENISVCGRCEDCGTTYREERYFWYENEGMLPDNLCVGCEVERYKERVYDPIGFQSGTELVDVGTAGEGRRKAGQAAKG
jgi:hypothetical protein